MAVITHLITVTLICTTLGVISGCSGQAEPYRIRCSEALNRSWSELDAAKADGFAGAVSYTKALSLLTAAKTMQTVENFDACVENAEKARFYISESRQGR